MQIKSIHTNQRVFWYLVSKNDNGYQWDVEWTREWNTFIIEIQFKKQKKKKTPARKCKNNTKTTDKMTIYTFLVHPLTLLCRDTSSSDTIWSARCTIHIQRHQQSTGEKKYWNELVAIWIKQPIAHEFHFYNDFFPGFSGCVLFCVFVSFF